MAQVSGGDWDLIEERFHSLIWGALRFQERPLRSEFVNGAATLRNTRAVNNVMVMANMLGGVARWQSFEAVVWFLRDAELVEDWDERWPEIAMAAQRLSEWFEARWKTGVTEEEFEAEFVEAMDNVERRWLRRRIATQGE